MYSSKRTVLSIVVPVFNEATGIAHFHAALTSELKLIKDFDFEILYINDGSTDGSLEELYAVAKREPRVRIISFSRNFGKEIAITAGISKSRGAAIISIDADMQHPIAILPEFIQLWRQGNKVVIGLRASNTTQPLTYRWMSRLFYRLVNKFAHTQLVSGATDFRLIDKSVQQQFNALTEHNRISRGLIDWLGFKPAYVPFDADKRHAGEARYTTWKLAKLAVDSLISLSITPLYITACLGFIVLPLATILGIGMIADAVLRDPLNLHATGSAYLSVFILFLVGMIMLSQGVTGLYLSHIHSETQNRPLYIIDEEASVRAS